jgi:hypothetical protein
MKQTKIQQIKARVNTFNHNSQIINHLLVINLEDSMVTARA